MSCQSHQDGDPDRLPTKRCSADLGTLHGKFKSVTQAGYSRPRFGSGRGAAVRPHREYDARSTDGDFCGQ